MNQSHSRTVIPAAAIVEAVTATGGNVAAAAALLGTTRENFYGHAVRRGINVPALKAQVMASVTLPGDTAPEGAAQGIVGDQVPFAEPVLSAVLTDLAATAMALQETQAALEQERRINASLIRELEGRAA